MKDFLRKYGIRMLIAFPLFYVAGIVFAPLALGLMLFLVLYLYIRKEHEMIFLLLALVLFFGDSRIPSLQFVKDLRVGLMVGLSVFSIWEIIKARIKLNKIFFWFFPFFVSAILSLLITDFPDVEEYFFIGMMKIFSFTIFLFVVFHYVRKITREKKLEMLKDLINMMNLLFVIGLVMIIIDKDSVFLGTSIRFHGLMGNPNGLGVLVTLLAPLYYFYFNRDPDATKSFRNFSYGLLILNLLMCSSRNAILSVGIFVFFVYAFNARMHIRFIVIFGVVPMALLFFLSFSIDDIVLGLGLEDYLRLEQIHDGSGRFMAWEWAMELIDRYPLMGGGFSYDHHVFLRDLPKEIHASGHQGGVHNSYLTLLLNCGYIGTVLFLIFIFRVLLAIKNMKILVPFAASAFTSATFEPWLVGSLNSFTIYFFLMILFLMNEQEELLAKPNETKENKKVMPLLVT